MLTIHVSGGRGTTHISRRKSLKINALKINALKINASLQAGLKLGLPGQFALDGAQHGPERR